MALLTLAIAAMLALGASGTSVTITIDLSWTPNRFEGSISDFDLGVYSYAKTNTGPYSQSFGATGCCQETYWSDYPNCKNGHLYFNTVDYGQEDLYPQPISDYGGTEQVIITQDNGNFSIYVYSYCNWENQIYIWGYSQNPTVTMSWTGTSSGSLSWDTEYIETDSTCTGTYWTGCNWWHVAAFQIVNGVVSQMSDFNKISANSAPPWDFGPSPTNLCNFSQFIGANPLGIDQCVSPFGDPYGNALPAGPFRVGGTPTTTAEPITSTEAVTVTADIPTELPTEDGDGPARRSDAGRTAQRSAPRQHLANHNVAQDKAHLEAAQAAQAHRLRRASHQKQKQARSV